MLRYSQKGYRMRVKCVVGVFLLFITVGGAALSQDDAGKLVFAVRKPLDHRDGFRAATRDAGKRSRND